MLYRIKQFFWGVESYFKEVDSKYINKFLDNTEKKLFDELKQNEKHHCIRVCKAAIDISSKKAFYVDKNKLGKVALLHDIGKTQYSLNMIEKSMLVILHKITKGKIKKYSNIKHIDIYYNHGDKGAELLKSYNKYDKEFLDTVRNHHKKNNNYNNRLLNIIKESDDIS